MSMKYILDIQFFASKKGVSSTKNGRDSHSKRLGAEGCRWSICYCWIYYLPSKRY